MISQVRNCRASEDMGINPRRIQNGCRCCHFCSVVLAGFLIALGPVTLLITNVKLWGEDNILWTPEVKYYGRIVGGTVWAAGVLLMFISYQCKYRVENNLISLATNYRRHRRNRTKLRDAENHSQAGGDAVDLDGIPLEAAISDVPLVGSTSRHSGDSHHMTIDSWINKKMTGRQLSDEFLIDTDNLCANNNALGEGEPVSSPVSPTRWPEDGSPRVYDSNKFTYKAPVEQNCNEHDPPVCAANEVPVDDVVMNCNFDPSDAAAVVGTPREMLNGDVFVPTVHGETPRSPPVLGESPRAEPVLGESPQVSSGHEEIPQGQSAHEGSPQAPPVLEESPRVTSVLEESPQAKPVLEESPRIPLVHGDSPRVPPVLSPIDRHGDHAAGDSPREAMLKAIDSLEKINKNLEDLEKVTSEFEYKEILTDPGRFVEPHALGGVVEIYPVDQEDVMRHKEEEYTNRELISNTGMSQEFMSLEINPHLTVGAGDTPWQGGTDSPREVHMELPEVHISPQKEEIEVEENTYDREGFENDAILPVVEDLVSEILLSTSNELFEADIQDRSALDDEDEEEEEEIGRAASFSPEVLELDETASPSPRYIAHEQHNSSSSSGFSESACAPSDMLHPHLEVEMLHTQSDSYVSVPTTAMPTTISLARTVEEPSNVMEELNVSLNSSSHGKGYPVHQVSANTDLLSNNSSNNNINSSNNASMVKSDTNLATTSDFDVSDPLPGNTSNNASGVKSDTSLATTSESTSRSEAANDGIPVTSSDSLTSFKSIESTSSMHTANESLPSTPSSSPSTVIHDDDDDDITGTPKKLDESTDDTTENSEDVMDIINAPTTSL